MSEGLTLRDSIHLHHEVNGIRVAEIQTTINAIPSSQDRVRGALAYDREVGADSDGIVSGASVSEYNKCYRNYCQSSYAGSSRGFALHAKERNSEEFCRGLHGHTFPFKRDQCCLLRSMNGP